MHVPDSQCASAVVHEVISGAAEGRGASKLQRGHSRRCQQYEACPTLAKHSFPAPWGPSWQGPNQDALS